MRFLNDGREQQPSRNAYRFGTAAVSVIALTMAMPALVQAQTAAKKTETLDEIIVTGIRYGIEKSLDLKRKELSLVEAVSAEDIGKLPNTSIAESLARLPGLAAQRVGGRDQEIAVRGLSSDFTTTLLNGRQQASSGDNRGVEFDQYPAELLSAVVVYKTPDANISGFGLAGTVDLRTVRPLAFGKRAIALNLRGEMTDGGRVNSDIRNFGGRFSASYIDQNESGTLGWAIGFAHLDSPSQTKHFKAYNYETFDGRGGNISPDSADKATFLTGQEIFARSRLNKRDAVMGILEWQPNEKIHSTVDLYYSQFNQRETMRGAQWFSNVWADNQNFTNVVTEQRGGTLFAVKGTNTGVSPQLRNDSDVRKDKLFSIGLNNDFQMTDHLKFMTDLSYSSSNRAETIIETYAGYGTGANAATQNDNRIFDTFTWDLSSPGFPTYGENLNYADASRVSLGDRAPWGGWGHDGLLKSPHVKDTIFALDAGLQYTADGFLSAFDIGVNFTRRTKEKTVDEFDLYLKNNRAQVVVDPQYLVKPTSLGYAGFGPVLAFNLPAALNKYYDQVVLLDANHFDKNWSLNEDVITFRAKATIDAGPLRGNIGVQVINQKQESSGSVITPPAVTAITRRASYTDILPSLNMIYDLGGGNRIRFAAAKVMARPRIDDMRASFTPGFGNPCGGSPPCVPGQVINPWSASGGNPALEPWRAKAVDLAYEWYISKASYISIAGFYKKLDTYIYTQRLPFDFTGVPVPPSQLPLIPRGVIISPIGQIDFPANGKGGEIKGIEISGALEFGKIAEALDGFGVQGSYSYTKSSLRPLALKTDGSNAKDVAATRIPGLSGTVYNVQGYYEKRGFEARVNYRWRSGFKGEVTQLFATRGVTEILAESKVDAQIGYTFQESSRLAGFGILLQANNLTNSAYQTRQGTDGSGAKTSDGTFLPQDYETYGRQFLFGINYKF
jgi:iron complex outermembrane recepter protein